VLHCSCILLTAVFDDPSVVYGTLCARLALTIDWFKLHSVKTICIIGGRYEITSFRSFVNYHLLGERIHDLSALVEICKKSITNY